MIIQSFNHLHDNKILNYCVDLEHHTLCMDTQTEAGETVSIHFTGLLAHRFENVISSNILFGMDEIDVDEFLQQYKDLLEEAMCYGFPAFTCRNTEELLGKMVQKRIRVFEVSSSLGLYGFVLAQGVEIDLGRT